MMEKRFNTEFLIAQYPCIALYHTTISYVTLKNTRQERTEHIHFRCVPVSLYTAGKEACRPCVSCPSIIFKVKLKHPGDENKSLLHNKLVVLLTLHFPLRSLQIWKFHIPDYTVKNLQYGKLFQKL